jgi:hypothetical protein
MDAVADVLKSKVANVPAAFGEWESGAVHCNSLHCRRGLKALWGMPAVNICEVMGEGWSFAFTLILRTGIQGHTNSLHRTHMGRLTATVRAQVL